MKRYNSLQEVQADISAGLTNCVELVRYYLANIEAQKHLNAYLEVFADEALARAQEVDRKIAAGTAGRLAGMVLGIKDVLAFKGHKLQASSQILNGFESQFTATAVQRLLDEDVIIIGRQNCDEFAMGASNENSSFGPVLNAADNSRVPGGSSGGTAVAVQADTCLAALGSDTGGSVRQPASFCGVIGLKPTYSRISRYGLIAYASSFDQIGPVTRSVEDAALLLEIMAGADDYDSTASRREVPAYSHQLNLNRKLRIGYISDTIESPGLQPEVKEAMLSTIESFREEGHEVESCDFHYLNYMVPTYYILTTAEASSNLARYDGVRYGYRSPNVTDLNSLYKKTRTEGFGPEVLRRIILGTFVLSADYYDAYYTKAQQVRRIIKEKTEELLQRFDCLILPTAPTTAFRIGENTKDPLAMYLADIFTVQASLAGVPAISVPAGSDNDGMPIGLQIIGRSFQEGEMMALARHVLENTQVKR